MMIALLLLTLCATTVTAFRSSPAAPRISSRLRAKNPFQDIVSSISNMRSTELNQGELAKIEALVDSSLKNKVGSWDEIASLLHSHQTPEERQFRSNLSNGYGRGSPLHRLRLFDESNKREDVRVTLYRDSGTIC